ncbi:hypothetical protein SUGI_0669740 [Cryptomeria japonica]|nr:hypothetical protein SUGI_0669740 [Cryptomeria japonica]
MSNPIILQVMPLSMGNGLCESLSSMVLEFDKGKFWADYLQYDDILETRLRFAIIAGELVVADRFGKN